MRILWFNNIIIPNIAKSLGEKEIFVGGWMVKLADEISKSDNIELVIAFPYKKNVHGKINNIEYYGFRSDVGKSNLIKSTEACNDIRMILKESCPDVIHIFGTEHIHSYLVVKECLEMGIIDRVTVSIQGLCSVISNHYTTLLPWKVIYGSTFRDLLKGNVYQGKLKFKKRGRYENELLKIVKHIIGRTEWDRATTWLINPNAKYYVNNEILRNEFYKHTWNFELCEKRSIFFSQATSPFKGLHIMIDALEMIKKIYPDVHLYIAGKSYMAKSKHTLSYYEKYILKNIESKNLEENVTFLGSLNETEICNRYLQSNVFISASTIENSPNSVGEAMILGVPTISSRVGGVHNLLAHGKEGFLYPSDEPYMLVYYCCKIFEDRILAENISKAAQKRAKNTHDVKKNLESLTDIYNEILSADSI